MNKSSRDYSNTCGNEEDRLSTLDFDIIGLSIEASIVGKKKNLA